MAAATIIIERLLALRRARVLPGQLVTLLRQWTERGVVTSSEVETLPLHSPLGRIVATGLANRHRGRAILRERVKDVGRHVVHQLERFLNTLGTIAIVSPLLGLLGTVFGMISMFFAVMVSGVGDPLKMAGGIGEALVCTASGLVVAIPAYFFHRYFRGRVSDLVIDMEVQVIALIDELAVVADAAPARSAG